MPKALYESHFLFIIDIGNYALTKKCIISVFIANSARSLVGESSLLFLR